MTKLLQNKSIIKFLGIALSILLIVALVPQINIAYGSKDDVLADTPTAEASDNTAAEGEEGAEDEETTEGVVDTSQEAGAQPGDIDPNMDESESNEPSNPGEGAIALMPDTNEQTPVPTKARAANSLGSNTIDPNDANVNDSNGVLTINGGSHTLTVNGTLERDIVVKNGATLTITGKGKIKGSGKGSVILVDGAHLIYGTAAENSYDEYGKNGPTVTGGIGSWLANKAAFASKVWALCGGGILVRKSSAKTPSSLVLNSGTVSGNKAITGGGIFIDDGCSFEMNGGKVCDNKTTFELAKDQGFSDDQKNAAKNSAHEGGGIFFAGSSGEIKAGAIENNTTNTTYDWGGGGVFVNSGSTLKLSSVRITGNTAHGLGGGISGCPHAEIGIGPLEDGAAVFGNIAEDDERPTNPALSFLTTYSTIKSNGTKVVGCGDYLALGISQKMSHTLTENNGATTVAKTSVPSGQYAFGKFQGRANDFYCTLASYISPTELGDPVSGIAWKGYKAGIPAVTANPSGTTLDSNNLKGEEVTIYLGQSYAAADESLGLTSEAKADSKDRKVFIQSNTSTTHGGGIGCNGTLEFGTLPKNEEKETVNPYLLSFDKELLNNVSDGKLDLKEGEFAFTLQEIDPKTEKEIGKEYKATNTAKGKVIFEGLDGVKSSTSKTFKLKEILTQDQKDKGYTSSLGDGKEVEVVLNVTQDKATIGSVTTVRYITTVGSVSIDGTNSRKITNTLSLKTSENIPVTKIADGIARGSFAFGFKKIDNIDDVVNDPSNPTALKQANSLVSIATAEGATVKETGQLADSTDQAVEGAVSFDTEEYTQPGTYWYAIAEQNGGTQNVASGVDYDGTTYLVKVDVTLPPDKRSLKTSPTIYKAAAGATALENATEAGVKFENVAMEYAGFNLGLTKQILTTLDKSLQLNGKTFNFALYDGEFKVAEGTTGPDGNLSLEITNDSAGEPYVKKTFAEGTKTFAFTLKEDVPEGSSDDFLTTIPDATVEVTLSAAGSRVVSENGRNGRTVYKVEPTVETVTVNDTDVAVAADKTITVINRYAPNGQWQFEADKFFYGLGTPRPCSFTMVELANVPEVGKSIDPATKDDKAWTAELETADFTEGKASIKFPAIIYKQEGTGDNKVNDIGDHYYLVTEDGDDAAKDTTAYVVKVTVAVDNNDPAKLTVTGTLRGYADDLDSALNPLVLPEGERPAFYNTDTYDLISAASYSVYAASGEPVDQVCYVDPKIVKNLEGRAIKSGEFAFKLIQVANYNDTEGELISATTNDEFGMVDFDKANNVSGDLENPSCLAYTKPGTYYYRVIEDTSKGGMNDQSVLYSDQVITFTTVIKQDETTGQLVCTDMYYGWWDAATNQNVRFDEQYADYETQPGNIGDMSKLNPDWHPTINNKARPMDLQVRKTSVSDRDEGLVGATYALYMVNENPQGDIWLAEATSEEGGWITYKNVSLATNNLYYFKETAAPAGHTVSEFRSPYFYLVEDATSANGYALKYTDTKYFDAAEVEAAAIPMAAAEAQALQADIAAQAEAAATGDQTQPGHSADGNILLTYDKDGGVYDETTQVEVNKLDTRTHEWVEGAKLVILEKESGKEVASWTSGKAPQKLAKTLNVGITYLLREVEAPGEYRLANDVEFIIDNYGNVTITKGTENGNAELSDNTITLYDTMMDAEEVEQRERETTREVPLGTILAQTGDMLPILGIGAIVLASLIALIVAGRRRHEGKDDKN